MEEPLYREVQTQEKHTGLGAVGPGLSSSSGTTNDVTLKPLPSLGPGFLPYETETRALAGLSSSRLRRSLEPGTCSAQRAAQTHAVWPLPAVAGAWQHPNFLQPRHSTQSPSARDKVMLSECRL